LEGPTCLSGGNSCLQVCLLTLSSRPVITASPGGSGAGVSSRRNLLKKTGHSSQSDATRLSFRLFCRKMHINYRTLTNHSLNNSPHGDHLSYTGRQLNSLGLRNNKLMSKMFDFLSKDPRGLLKIANDSLPPIKLEILVLKQPTTRLVNQLVYVVNPPRTRRP